MPIAHSIFGHDVLDLRQSELTDMGEAVELVDIYQAMNPNIHAVMVTVEQRTALVMSNPRMFKELLALEKRFNKPLEQIDFGMVIGGCAVEVDLLSKRGDVDA